MGTKYNQMTAMRTYENSDERYTKREAIIPLMKYLPKGKRYWLPCDTDESNYTKIFKEYGMDFINTHIATGQDFYKYEPSEWDILVTNPPFSNKTSFVSRVLGFGKPFALLMPLTWINDLTPYKLFAGGGLQLMIFDRRTEFVGAPNNNRISFKCGYYSRGILPRDIVFEKLDDEKGTGLW